MDSQYTPKMPSFHQFLRKSASNATRFFNTTLPSAVTTGVRFFNTHVVPTARKIHSIQSAITTELKTNENVPTKLRGHATKASAFADLGLARFNQGSDAINRVAGQLGLSGT